MRPACCPVTAARRRRRALPSGLVLGLLLAVGPAPPVAAQAGTNFNQRDDEYRLLGLKRAKAAYEVAQQDVARQETLFAQQLISQQELDRSRSSLADAEVNYQQSLLAVLFEKQWVSVRKAVKRRDADGRKFVRLTVANASGGGEEFRKLVDVDDALFRSLQPDVVHDVYVSLLNDENVIISQPYEAKIERLRFGQPVEIEFQLLQDVDAVTVDIVYGSGTQRSPKIYLEKDASEDKVLVQSAQFSQEAELGAEATFELTLELFSGVSDTFRLEVVNLPRSINHQFVDPVSQARLRQFKFTDRADTRRAGLKVFLPDRTTEDVVVDQPIPFSVLVIPRDRSGERIDLNRSWTPAELARLDVGQVPLELVPRGVGKLLVRAPQLFFAIGPEEVVEVGLEVVNEGTRRLDNVEIEVDPPLHWQEEADPAVIPALDVGEERGIRLRFTPPSDVSVGRYEFRVRTTSVADNQPLSGEEKSVTVEVRGATNVLATTLLVVAIVGLVLGLVIFGVRLSRR